MRQSDLFKNPAIEQPLYVHIKVINVEVEDTPSGPRVFVEMQIPPEQPQLSGRRLYAIIHSVHAAEYTRYKFRETFGVEGIDFEAAAGKWAAVRLIPTQCNGTGFSNVQFVAQTPISRQKSQKFASLEASGEMPPWDEDTSSIYGLAESTDIRAEN